MPNVNNVLKAVVRFICNGYTVTIHYTDKPLPTLCYAGSIAEVVYYLAEYFEGEELQKTERAAPEVTASENLMNQEAEVVSVDTGGYLVREMQSPYAPQRPLLDEFCPNMDAVATELNEIYAYVEHNQ